jgi:two-component system, OmpR family, response regulator
VAVTTNSVIRVLLIEDDQRLAQLTARYLIGHQVDVAIVSNGADALESSRVRPPDIVLLDLMLPGQDGLEICRNLRTRLDVPIIMLTARGEEADRVLGFHRPWRRSFAGCGS